MNEHVYIDLLAESVKKHESLPCLHIKRAGTYTSWTYGAFHRDLNRLASVLKKHGLRKGVNAIVIGENMPEWIIAYHAIILTGACTVPVDPNIPAVEIESILATTEAKIVFCSTVYLGLFRQLKGKYRFLEQIILLDPGSEEKEPRFDRFIAEGDGSIDAFSTRFGPDDPMVVIFTSGTTGKAKGAVLCQKNFTAVCRHAVPRMKVDSNDTVCAVLPLHHVFGCAAGIVGPLYAGMDIVFVPYLKGPLILEALIDKGVTYLPAVPKLLQLFYDSILHNVRKKGPLVKALFSGMQTVSAAVGERLGEGFKRKLFSSVHKGFGGKLRLVISGGAALSRTYWNGFRRLGFTIVEGYGLTETFGPITVCPGEHARLGSVGPVLPENELRIIDRDGSGIGEVLLRGSCVFKGYYNNEELNREVVDAEGWFHTGDLGRTDADGYLYLSGRKKDVIVLESGKNVYPEELEEYYGVSPLIEEIGVFGIETDNKEIVAAAIVPEASIRKTKSRQQATDLLYAELLRLGRNVPVYRRISDFVVSSTPLPRTTTRKLKKTDLRRMYHAVKQKRELRSPVREELSVIEMAMMETDEYRRIVELILRLAPKNRPERITARSHLEIDLGLDSLDRIELLSLLEKGFSISVPEQVFDKMETMSDLVSLVRDSIAAHQGASIERTLGIKERIFADASVDVSAQLPKRRPVVDFLSGSVGALAAALRPASVSGIERIVSAPPPLIFAANHTHRSDLFDLLVSLPPPIRRKTLFLGDPEASASPAVPYILFRHAMIALLNPGDPIEILKVSTAALRRGDNIIFFPEGAISGGGEVKRFKPAIGLLALESNASVAPVRIIRETGRKTVLRFGKPATVQSMIADGTVEAPQPTAEAVADAVRKMVTAL
ncbi:MAG: AMP-binding protein [Chitinispirillaceae bacterium]|nr:AMP-binding protein [Chitinispirillaceae bacterium]